MESYILNTPEEVSLQIAARMKKLRLNLGWKQDTLAKRSGVSLASLRRFETKGLISLESLLKLALSLNCLQDFDKVFLEQEAKTISELEEKSKKPQRGRK